MLLNRGPRGCVHAFRHQDVTVSRVIGRPTVQRIRGEAVNSASSEEMSTAFREMASKLARKRLRISYFDTKASVNWGRWELQHYYRLEAMEKAGTPQDQATEEVEEDIPQLPTTQDGNASFFSQYNNPLVGQARLLDSAYVAAWAAAVEALGPQYIKDKTVIDVGCGPGLLSLLCAKAGAKKVIAIDASEGMANVTRQVADANGYSDIIEVVHGRVEDVTLQDKADVLVSDWVGPGMLGGNMLPSVAHARQRLLKKGGLVLPSQASISVTGIEDRAALAGLKSTWDDIAGFNMSAAMARVITTARVSTIQRQSQLCTDTVKVHEVDLNQVKVQDALQGVQRAPFKLQCQRDERLFGLLMHFDLDLGFGSDHVPFSTSPRNSTTSFQQVVLNFPRSIKVQKGDVLEGTLTLQPSKTSPRDMDIELKIVFNGVEASITYQLAHSMPSSAHSATVARLADL